MPNENINLFINAKDRTGGVLGNIKKSLVSIGAAYLSWRVANDIIGESIKQAADYEATLVSLDAVIEATGRDAVKVYSEMESHLGGLASKANIAAGFLKGMTTELNVEQISQMTTAIKDASIAMGEDFNTQLPMIIKAIKQLNPAILDNIGVTVRLDKVNQRIADGYYGAGTAINEFTQQNAIFHEIMKQTLKFQGQEAKFLETNAGKMAKLKVEVQNLAVVFGDLLLSMNIAGAVNTAIGSVKFLIVWMEVIPKMFELWKSSVAGWFTVMSTTLSSAGKSIASFARLIAAVTSNQWLLAAAEFEILKNTVNQGIVSIAADLIANSVNVVGFVETAVKASQDAILAYVLATNEIISTANTNRSTETFEQLDFDQRQMNKLHEDAKNFRIKLLKVESNEDRAIHRLIRESFEEEEDKKMAAVRKFANLAGNTIDRFANEFVSAMETGRFDLQGIFKAMAADFIKFFIQQALTAVLNMLIPGIGALLGGMFDTPRYDQMAMTQGKHFVQYFAKGVEQQFNDSIMGRRIANSANDAIRSTEGFETTDISGQGRSDGGIVVNFNGPVTSDQFVEEITPMLVEASVSGISPIKVRPRSLTGKFQISGATA